MPSKAWRRTKVLLSGLSPKKSVMEFRDRHEKCQGNPIASKKLYREVCALVCQGLSVSQLPNEVKEAE